MGHWKRKSVAIVRQVALSTTRPFLLSGIHFNAVAASGGDAAPRPAVSSGCVRVVADSDAAGDFCGGGGWELEPARECGAGGYVPSGVAAEGGGL